MSFQIPKDLKEFNSLLFMPLLPIGINDVDVDRMMVHLLEMCVKQGRIRPSRTNVDAFDRYVKALCEHPAIGGLEGDDRRAVLQGWLQAAVIKIGRAGKDRSTPKMDYARPITIAAYRSGLPKSRSRNRGADVLIYHSMLDELARRQAETREAELSALVKEAYGRGLDLGGSLDDEPRYDGKTPLDVNALLALDFFDSFEERGAATKVKLDLEIAVPGAVRPLGRDAVSLLALYGPQLPPIEGTSRLAALLSLGLFQLPLRTALAVRQLLSTGSRPSDMLTSDSPNPLQIYCDFTMVSGSSSDDLARRCVQRDLDAMRQFFSDRMRLRSLFLALPIADPRLAQENSSLTEKLEELLGRVGDLSVIQALRMQVQQIENGLASEPDGQDGLDLIRELRAAGVDGADLITRILVESLAPKRGLENQIKWFWSTGGINKPYGILRGRQAVRTSWRYSPSDDLLVSILLAAFVRNDGMRSDGELGIEELLRRLEDRFGILIARAPEAFDSADARSGAAENRNAFIRRLQLLGCFEGLSDDFSAQFVRRPRAASA